MTTPEEKKTIHNIFTSSSIHLNKASKKILEDNYHDIVGNRKIFFNENDWNSYLKKVEHEHILLDKDTVSYLKVSLVTNHFPNPTQMDFNPGGLPGPRPPSDKGPSPHKKP